MTEIAQLAIGQRWVSDTESELGLGRVVNIDHRLVSISFPACEESRTYAINNAPLSRVRFAVGDVVECDDGEKLTVTEVEAVDGLLFYQGHLVDGSSHKIDELSLSAFIHFSQPQDRLFAGKVDADRWFQLRYLTQQLHERQTQSNVYGLSGARASLIKHQLYIAHEVANRHAPRVLLADEVGLGKTIEAGLIMHQQLLTGRAQRVLIIVPESLCFQWLVELFRRFNLSFSLFDEERCADFDGSDDDEPQTLQNPFLSEQWVLCSQQFLVQNPHRKKALLTGEWDTLVVDEAHHLEWSEQEISAEYALIEALAACIPSVLLLTATPEQLGRASHFARLRLLDSDRFYDLATFIKEEQAYEPVATIAEQLLTNTALQPAQKEYLHELLGDSYADRIDHIDAVDAVRRSQARESMVTALLDRHGTGRALFRNTRKTVAGFPERKAHGYALTMPEIYKKIAVDSVQECLHPETTRTLDASSVWHRMDPRIDWLRGLLTDLNEQKVLLICASAQTVLDLEQVLNQRFGIRSAVFHEGMSIIQRDRSAAYFADDENHSAQILLCSEIGSEGRNFQFAHHLILFDLPLNPDLLEQRIGRLDRIGQKSTIHIHIPYFENSAQQVLFQWYQQGLGAFEHTCPTGQAVFSQLGGELENILRSMPDDSKQVDGLVQRARELHQQLDLAMQKGRDHLLELSSCRTKQAEALIEDIQRLEKVEPLKTFMQSVCDQYAIDFEVHSEKCYIIRPGSHMLVSAIPWLPEDGATVTFDRQMALEREELLYLTWEHPMVVAVMDLVLNDERGNASAIVIDGRSLPIKHQVLLEVLYVVECSAPKTLQLSRFFPMSTIRLLLSPEGQDCSKDLGHQKTNGLRMKVSLSKADMKKLIDSQKASTARLLKKASQRVADTMEANKEQAIKKMMVTMKTEVQRMSSLQKVNPNVRDEEIEYLKGSAQDMLHYIQHATPKLDALRLVFITRT